MFIIRYISVLLFLCMTLVSFGQDQLRVYTKYSDDTLLVRWKPLDPAVWGELLPQGYIVRRYENSIGDNYAEYRIKHNFSGLPDFLDDEDPLFLISRIINIHLVDQADFDETFPKDEYSDEDVLLARSEILNHLLHRSFQYTLDAGLGFMDTSVRENTDYIYRIFGNFPNDSLVLLDEFTFNTKNNEPPPVVTLNAGWSDRKVELVWTTMLGKEYYYGYSIEKSFDGEYFFPYDSSIIVNPYDTSALEVHNLMAVTDYLPSNDTTVYYRLYFHDYFGAKSENYSEVAGTGVDVIGLSPLLHTIRQAKGNKAHLKWSILPKFEHLVHSWRIYVGEQWEGPYFPDSTDIHSDEREALRPIPFKAAYYRVVAVDTFGMEHSSFPQLVVSLDTIAPEVPVNLTYEIDTSGILLLKWDMNQEDDFLGYKVFSSYDSLGQYILRHDYFIPESMFRDTIGLYTETRYVYYKIIAVDDRNNRSEFSEILKIPIPDILPPIQPRFHTFEPQKGKIALAWHPSESEDVVKQSLYRRQAGNDVHWNLVKEWMLPDIDTSYYDADVIPLVDYSYILKVTDITALVSEPSEHVTVYAFPDYDNFPIDSFEIDVSAADCKIRINFDFPMGNIYELALYKGAEGNKESLFKTFHQPVSIFCDNKVEEGKKYSYRLRIIFKDGTKSKFSQRKIIQL